MYKLHKPHLKNGYIERVTFEETWREDGTRDWTMIYVPGARARGEHVAAQTGKHIPRAKVIHPDPQQLTFNLPDHAPKHLPQPAPAEEESLVTKLHGFGVSEKKAKELVKTRREAVEAQIAAARRGSPEKTLPDGLSPQ